ncbi:hypothetical protein MMC25_000959 [Agyrium rufum]|nr:hypothetical protein [Agyrium rufum]
MAGVHRIGFTELSSSDGAGKGPLISPSIVFVHGLRGHPRETWEDSRQGGNDGEGSATSKRNPLKSIFKSKSSPSTTNSQKGESNLASQRLFWPKEYLTEDLPQARIWTYGYNADVIGGLFQANNKNSVSQHGQDLAVRIEREIENEEPIVFVAHGLGGIIVKDALHRSKLCAKRTKLIIFLGTPHRGSSYAGWGEIASNLARIALQDSHKKIIETLEPNSEVLDNIHEEFKSIVNTSGVRIHSFQEARGISGMKGLHEKVVDDFSSKLDLPRPLETVESIDANHMQMVRCIDRTDPRYRAISGVLKQFLRGGLVDREGDRIEGISSLASRDATQGVVIASEVSGVPNERCSPYRHIPFPKNRRFVGRTANIETIKQKLFTERDCEKVALFGLGGVGKTQVALQFAYWVKKNWPEYSIFWVAATNAESFEQAYTEIARLLAISKAADEDVREMVQRYLSLEAAGKWLLIVDNADEMDVIGSINKYLPENEEGLILFTTRHRAIAVSLARSDVVELQKMDQQEAMSYLEKSLIRKNLIHNTVVATELLDELTFLPLAITQAAAYLNVNQLSIREYLQLLRGTEQNVISLMSREFRDNTRYENSDNAVATTWLVSFDQIRKYDTAAADILAFISRIEPKAIPRSILPELQSEEQVAHGIGTLRAYAFMVRRGDSEVYDVHRLVHFATRIWVQKCGVAAQTTKIAIEHLAAAFPSDDWANRGRWREYLPHVFKLLQGNQGADIQEKYELYLRVGVCLRADGRIKEAVSCLMEAYLWMKSRFPETDPRRLASQHGLAGAYQADGQVSKAIKLLEHVVAVREKVLAENHPSRLASQHGLAGAYEANGQVSKAIKLLEHVVAVQEKVLAENHPDQLASQHELARAYEANGELGKGIKLLERVVRIKRKALRVDHPSRLVSQDMLKYFYDRRTSDMGDGG